MFIDPFIHGGDPIHSIQASGFEIQLERKRIPDLVVSSGQFIACDPLESPESEPFVVEVPPASYPVYVLYAHTREDKLPAFLSIEISPEKAVKWEVATVTGEDPVVWNDPDPGGFHVDSGVAAIMDVVGADFVLDTIASAEGEDEFIRTIQGRLNKARRGNGMGWAELSFGLRDGTNIVAFEVKDGVYTTFLGRTSGGALTRVVIDLNVLDFQFTPYGIRLPANGNGSKPR